MSRPPRRSTTARALGADDLRNGMERTRPSALVRERVRSRDQVIGIGLEFGACLSIDASVVDKIGDLPGQFVRLRSRSCRILLIERLVEAIELAPEILRV